MAGIISFGMRIEVGWYYDRAMYKSIGLLFAVGWALLWYLLWIFVPNRETPSVAITTTSWYTNFGLAIMQIIFQVLATVAVMKYPRFTYSGYMAMLQFISMTNIPMQMANSTKLDSFPAFSSQVGFKLISTYIGMISITLVGTLINPVYAYHKVSNKLADMIYSLSLHIPGNMSIMLSKTDDSYNLRSEDDGNSGVDWTDDLYLEPKEVIEKRRKLLLKDFKNLRSWSKAQSKSVKVLLSPSKMELQLEDNAQYSDELASKVLSSIMRAMVNAHHMVLLSRGVSELEDDVQQRSDIIHDQWMLNRMHVLRLRAAESALRSRRPIDPAFPSTTFDAANRLDTVARLRDHSIKLINDGKIATSSRILARNFFAILLFRDVTKIEEIVSEMYGNRSRKYLKPLQL